MEFRTKAYGEIGVLLLSGELDLYNTPQIPLGLEELRAAGVSRVIVELGELSYVDSSGIGALLGAQRKLKEEGGDLVLANSQGSVQKVFVLTRLHALFRFFDSEEDARKALSA